MKSRAKIREGGLGKVSWRWDVPLCFDHLYAWHIWGVGSSQSFQHQTLFAVRDWEIFTQLGHRGSLQTGDLESRRI